MKFDVFGIGNPLMDILIQVDDQHLIDLNLKKGIMHLVEETEANQIMEKVKDKPSKMVPAGGTTNTLMGIAILGGKSVLCGKIGRDDHGDIYEDIITKQNIQPRLVRCDKKKTGKVINFVTPDAERTFATHLGAAINLETQDVFDEDLKQSKILYFTGYEFEAFTDTVKHALDIAKQNNVKIALDLADPELVKRNLDNLKQTIKDYVDILFLNEHEAKSFTGMEPEQALDNISKMVDIAVVKVGKQGSLIKKGEEKITIQPHNAESIDTTGAGDLYAAGFLYALTQGHDLKIAGNLGSYISAKIVEQMGAKIDSISKEEVEKIINQ